MSKNPVGCDANRICTLFFSPSRSRLDRQEPDVLLFSTKRYFDILQSPIPTPIPSFNR